jgi:hypothetical protein
MISALLVLAILLSQDAAAKVKKHTDEQGTLHITNVEPGEPGPAPPSTKGPPTSFPGGKAKRSLPQPPPDLEPEPPPEVEEIQPDEPEPPPEPPPPSRG